MVSSPGESSSLSDSVEKLLRKIDGLSAEDRSALFTALWAPRSCVVDPSLIKREEALDYATLGLSTPPVTVYDEIFIKKHKDNPAIKWHEMILDEYGFVFAGIRFSRNPFSVKDLDNCRLLPPKKDHDENKDPNKNKGCDYVTVDRHDYVTVTGVKKMLEKGYTILTQDYLDQAASVFGGSHALLWEMLHYPYVGYRHDAGGVIGRDGSSEVWLAGEDNEKLSYVLFSVGGSVSIRGPIDTGARSIILVTVSF